MGSGARRAPAPSLVLLLRHREKLLTRHLTREFGMVALDVLLGVSDQLVVRCSLDRVAALTVDDLRHRPLLGCRLQAAQRDRGHRWTSSGEEDNLPPRA